MNVTTYAELRHADPPLRSVSTRQLKQLGQAQKLQAEHDL